MAQKRNQVMLIDTNVFVDYLRGHEPARKFFSSLSHYGEVAFSAITETEIMTGSANDDVAVREKTLNFLRQWTKLSLGNPVASFAGDLRREHGLAVPDAIIAATARAHNAELITRNLKDFQRVPELRVRAPY
jgi:hypothetical protein